MEGSYSAGIVTTSQPQRNHNAAITAHIMRLSLERCLLCRQFEVVFLKQRICRSQLHHLLHLFRVRSSRHGVGEGGRNGVGRRDGARVLRRR